MQLLKMGIGNDNVRYPKLGEKPFEETLELFSNIIADEKGLPGELAAQRDIIMSRACAGYPGAANEATMFIKQILDLYTLSIKDLSVTESAYEIYKKIWGLDVLEEIYNDPEVDDIYVNSPDHVYVKRKGRNERTAIRFEDDDHIHNIIVRQLMHDKASITTTKPMVESKRKDGTRITATIPYITQHPTISFRKHNTFIWNLENLIRAGTLNEKVYKLLQLLVKGMANILISGGTGSAKTSLLRHMVSFMHPNLRIITLENDHELEIAKYYPDRNVIAFEEQPEIGVTMKELFRLILRKSPDVILVGEIRGLGEAEGALDACLRGHDGSIATIHTSSVSGAINGLAMMTIREGKNLPLDYARLEAATGFDIVIQMYSSKIAGIKKIIEVTEVGVKNDQIFYNTLCRWKPEGDDYLVGDWEFPNKPTSQLINKFIKAGVSYEDIKAVDFEC